jgi:hypothetical protein
MKRADGDAAAQRFCELFPGSERGHGTHGEPVRDGDKWAIKTTAKTFPGPATAALWERHLAGERPLGVIPVRGDSTCGWGSIDVDRYDDEAELVEIINRVAEAKQPLVPCRSKSGGLHLFLFLTEAAPAGDVQTILREIAARLGLGGCEIFPKQEAITAGRGEVGNWMVMPYFGGTFGGKLTQQVGVTRAGEDVPVADFLDTAEAARVTAGAVAAAASGPRPKARPRTNGQAPAGAPFADGPPCLERLAAAGVERGGQNNFLLMIGIYMKRADPERWQDRLAEANNKFLTPPGSFEGLQSVIKSLSKKDYEYTCKTEPMCSHCDVELCQTRQFGVGGGFPHFSLIKVPTDPVEWIMELGDGRTLKFVGTELLDYRKFKEKMLIKYDDVAPPLKKAQWEQLLKDALGSRLKIVEAPPDLGDDGEFREQLSEFLTNRSRGERREDVVLGRPWQDPEDGRHYFRLRDLTKFLGREVKATVGKKSRSWITDQLEKLGGGHRQFKVQHKNIQVWWVPREAGEEPVDVGPPAERGGDGFI